MSRSPIGILSITHLESPQSNLEEKEVLKPRSTLILGIILLIFLVQIRLGFAKPIVIAKPILELPPGFVELRGPHGRTVLIGPLQVTPNGGYERVVVILGQPPFMVSTEPGVTPQEIADVYG